MKKYYNSHNFYLLNITLTITIMFFVISYVLEKYPNDVVRSRWVALVLSWVLSTGLFTTLSGFLVYLFETKKRIKSWMLVDHFLEGFWVGFIEGGEEVTFVVEKIEQSIDEIKLNGVSYRLNENRELVPTSSWNSTVAKIMNNESELQYTYLNSNFKGADDSSKQFTGFGKFHYETFSNRNNGFIRYGNLKFPLIKSCSMYGQLNDFTPEGEILLSTEIKISDSLQYDIDYFKRYAFMFWEYRKNMSKIDC